MIRDVNERDLAGLLALYRQLHDASVPEQSEALSARWSQILEEKNHHIIVADVDGKLVSSCVLVVMPKLTQGQRPYALVENVITDEPCRNHGYASARLNYASARAETAFIRSC